jgi:UDP-N-acetylmuramoyl-L-alanyl-D-glutamate--2,6-diaminopimelate ligase
MQVLQNATQVVQWLKERVTGTLTSDSRLVQAGDCFIAWPGAATDGRKFVHDALQRGAACCLVELADHEVFALPTEKVAAYIGLKVDTGSIASEFHGSPSQALSMIAVTGTNGKTSTAWWLAQALSALPLASAIPCGVVGTLGVGSPPVLDGLQAPAASGMGLVVTGMTTPDPVLLQHTLRGFVDQGLKACAIEASSIGIEEHRLDGTQIRVAVFTNFTQDHLDYHGTMDAYWESKRKLFSWPGLRSAVINIDDVYGSALAESLGASGLDLWTVSCKSAARLVAANIVYAPLGLKFDVLEGAGVVSLQTHMIGSYNVSNLLGVLATMRSLGVSLQDAVAVCAALRPVPGRMECMGGDGAPLVAVDYAHTPDALAHALAALRPLAAQRGGKLWCVFGCGGDRDTSKRPLMGAIAAQQADQVVVTSDNPRNEKPEAIIAQILLGLARSNSVAVQVDRAVAISDAVAQADANDVVLLAGKGHELTQEIAGQKFSFSDHTQALQALNIWRASASEGCA